MASIAMEPENVAAEPYAEKAAEAGVPVAKERLSLLADVVLRFLLFASGLVAALVMVTSNETQAIAQIPVPPFLLYKTAKFSQSPAFIFYVAAVSVAGLYGLITTLISFFSLIKPSNNRTNLISRFIIFDTVLLGMVASAIGAAGGVAYIGLMGNKEIQWNKICNLYTDFCIRGGASIAVSLIGSALLILLVILSVHSLSRKIPKHN